MSTTSISQTMNFPVTKPTQTKRLKRSWIDKKPTHAPKSKTSPVGRTLSTSSITNYYAGPSFTDSPVPQQVPLPPSQWLENNSEYACKNCSICESARNRSSPEEMITSRICSIESLQGLRLTPLQLIQAVAS